MTLAENIAHELGKGKEKKNETGWLTCCPVHGDEKPSLSIMDSTDSNGNPDIIVHCHTGCGFEAVKDELRASGYLPEWEPGNGQRKPLNGSRTTAGGGKKDNLPAFIWSKSKQDQEAAEVIRKAFTFRGIDLEEIPPNMRLNEYEGKRSIVCAMQHPLETEAAEAPEAVHMTHLNEEGYKAGTQYHGPKKGRAVLLYNDENRLVIGEGLETTLSATQATGYSGMVCGDAGNMASMTKLPERFREIFILVDSDTTFTGQRAALEAAENIAEANSGASVFLVTPDDSCFTGQPLKRDFNNLPAEAIQERFKAAEQVSRAVLERLGDAVGYGLTADGKEQDQPDSPLPLTKKNEQSEPFPFDALGDIMAAACRDIQRAVQAPDALIAQSVLASANLAVQPLRDVVIDGRVFPLSLFLLTI